eukprot:379793-Rhodomonas_salina.2
MAVCPSHAAVTARNVSRQRTHVHQNGRETASHTHTQPHPGLQQPPSRPKSPHFRPNFGLYTVDLGQRARIRAKEGGFGLKRADSG